MENCRQALQKISQSVDLVGELDGLINNFVENRFRQGARDMYSSMINSASAATQRTLDARLQGVIKKLEPAAPQVCCSIRAEHFVSRLCEVSFF